MRLKVISPILLLPLVFLTACKDRSAANAPVVHRAPRLSGPTTEDATQAAIADLRDQLQILPVLENPVSFIDAKSEDWAKYPNGMMTHDLKRSNENGAAVGKTVTITYTGTVAATNVEFDHATAEKPFTFIVNSKNVIKGLSMGIVGLRTGGHRRIYIPAEFAYGAEGNPSAGIGRNQALIFDVELLSVTGQYVDLQPPPDLDAVPLGPKAP